ncbi:MAG TPA: TonB family protein [Sphingobium sp.]
MQKCLSHGAYWLGAAIVLTILAGAPAATQPSVVAPPLPGAPAAPPAPPPPIIAIPAGSSTLAFKQELVDNVPGPVTCDDEVIMPVAIERPFPVMANSGAGGVAQPVTFTFRIDPDGRPLGIAQMRDMGPAGPRLYYNTADLAPSLAASRFPAGKPQQGCQISYAPHTVRPAEAPVMLAQRYLVSPHARQSSDVDVFRRIHAVDTNCIDAGTPKLRARVYPDFDKIPQPRGTWAYAMIAFDIDAQGKPVKVRIASSDGNAALDRASVDAVKKSRFAPEARHGCTYPYYRMPAEPLEAPMPPDKTTLTPANAKCDAEAKWSFMPALVFPAGFQTRRVEGWALIGYDVAPWGQTGNVRVLAAEPAAAFGEQALNIVRSARKETADTGMTGCVTMVRFVMPPTRPAADPS